MYLNDQKSVAVEVRVRVSEMVMVMWFVARGSVFLGLGAKIGAPVHSSTRRRGNCYMPHEKSTFFRKSESVS